MGQIDYMLVFIICSCNLVSLKADFILFLSFKAKEDVGQQESTPAAAGEAPNAVENNSVHADPEAPPSNRPASAFPDARRVSTVDETCCGGFAVKSKICVIQ